MARSLALDDDGAVEACVSALAAGDAIVVPTDTVYGVATLPSAVERLYALKGRPESIPIAVLVESLVQAQELADLSGVVGRLAREFWPGPLTIVARRRDGNGTVGIRCPDHVFLHVVTRRVGPIATTSANAHGQPTATTVAAAVSSLAGDVAVAIDGGECNGVASTVVDTTRPDLPVLRVGSISQERINAVALR